mmetsp:Transcript_18439/g.60027  ORF Transcript_18439/g.60027 Transcript_18439/m.60027 type:complete len:495 (+) Transcript_18439:1006-2490(+)
MTLTFSRGFVGLSCIGRSGVGGHHCRSDGARDARLLRFLARGLGRLLEVPVRLSRAVDLSEEGRDAHPHRHGAARELAVHRPRRHAAAEGALRGEALRGGARRAVAALRGRGRGGGDGGARGAPERGAVLVAADAAVGFRRRRRRRWEEHLLRRRSGGGSGGGRLSLGELCAELCVFDESCVLRRRRLCERFAHAVEAADRGGGVVVVRSSGDGGRFGRAGRRALRLPNVRLELLHLPTHRLNELLELGVFAFDIRGTCADSFQSFRLRPRRLDFLSFRGEFLAQILRLGRGCGHCLLEDGDTRGGCASLVSLARESVSLRHNHAQLRHHLCEALLELLCLRCCELDVLERFHQRLAALLLRFCELALQAPLLLVFELVHLALVLLFEVDAELCESLGALDRRLLLLGRPLEVGSRLRSLALVLERLALAGRLSEEAILLHQLLLQERHDLRLVRLEPLLRHLDRLHRSVALRLDSLLERSCSARLLRGRSVAQ